MSWVTTATPVGYWPLAVEVEPVSVTCSPGVVVPLAMPWVDPAPGSGLPGVLARAGGYLTRMTGVPAWFALWSERELVGEPSPVLWGQSVEILEAAGELLSQQGWTQGRWIDREGRRCAWAALRKAAEGCGRLAACGLAAALVDEVTGVAPVPAWNDTVARSVEDVLLGFKRAVELAERWGAGRG